MTTLDDIYNLPDVFFIAGDTKTIDVFALDENGAILDLTGASCSIKIFPLGQDDILIISLTGTIVDAVAGHFQCVFDGEDSSELSGIYVSQIFITDIDEVEHIPSQGRMTISPKSALS